MSETKMSETKATTVRNVTRRQLAARFVDQLAASQHPLPQLAAALMQAATEAGYGRDLGSLVTMVEYELQARYGAVEVRLATAHELPAAALEQLAAQVAQRVGARSHSTTHRTDPALLGGFEAEAGDSVIHGSVSANLTNLTASGVHNG